jgi:hypothetical protein
MQPYTLLTIQDVITKGNDFTYKFSGGQTYNKINSIQEFANLLGDPTHPPKNNLYLSGDTIHNLINTQMQDIDVKVQSILNNPTALQEVKDHFAKNQDCREVHLYYPIPVRYPDVNNSVDLKKIITHYIALQTKVGSLTIDEYIDRAVQAQTVIARTLKSVIQSFDSTWASLDTVIDNMGGYQNAVNKSFQSAKYGILENNPMSQAGAQENLLHNGLLNTSTMLSSVFRTNYSGPDAFTGGYEVPFGMASTTIKMIIGLSYYNITGLIVPCVHEIGHELDAQSGLTKLSRNAINYVSSHMPKKILEKGYRAAPGAYVLDGCWGEHVCDLIGILCAEGYIRTLGTLQEKIQAIRGAMIFAFDSSNRIDGNHPPNSMRRNLILISKYIHDILLGVRRYKLMKNIAVMGGKRRKTQRKNRKNRKATYRRRR